jgi:AraC-like DNA-binding protein
VVEALRDPAADGAAAIAGPGCRPRICRRCSRGHRHPDAHVSPVAAAAAPRLALVGRLDLTAAAHAGDFADLAHFSRTCRRMLGYPPSVLRENLMSG